MAEKKLTQLSVPSVAYLQGGMPMSTFTKGADLFEKVRVGEHVEVVLDDGTKRPARVQMVQVDALINLVTGYGAQAAMNQGRPYSALAVVQGLTDAAAGSGPLDVTKIYTMVQVQLEPEIPTIV